MTAPTRVDIAYPAIGSRRLRGLRDPLAPHVIVLFGATGDLAKRKLLPGLAYLAQSSARPGHPRRRHAMDDMDDRRSSARSRGGRSTSFGTHTIDDGPGRASRTG